MKRIEYSPDAADKLRTINRAVLIEYGSSKAKEIIGKITKAIRGLCEFEEKGASVEGMFGIRTDYRYIYVMRNYVFYEIQSESIRIINIYNEREDFIWLLFGLEDPQDFTEL